MEKEMYTAPVVEIIEVEVEKGFATSMNFDSESGNPTGGNV